MTDEEDDGRQATINMMSNGGEDYQRQIDERNINVSDGDEDAARQEDEGRQATINMMSNGGADYQRQIDAEDRRMQIERYNEMGAEHDSRIERERRERETSVLNDASLSPAEMRDESGNFNVFGGLLSGNKKPAVSKTELKLASL